MAAGTADFGDFAFLHGARVLCASCGRFFGAERPKGDVSCTLCGEVVQVGARVVRKRRVASRTSPGREGRSSVSDAVLRASMCAALVGAAAFAFAMLCGPEKQQASAGGACAAGKSSAIMEGDSGEW